MSQRNKRLLATGVVLCLTITVMFGGCATKKERLEKEEAYRQIGINAMEEGDYDAAMEAFNHALEQTKSMGANEVDICYYKAAAQFAAGSYGGAVETYDLLLEYDSKNENAYFLRGCVYLKNNESDKAQDDFAKAVKYADDNEIYLKIYHVLEDAGQEEEAEAYLSDALSKKAGRKAKNYTVKGRIYLLQEDYENAKENLVTAVEKGDSSANLYLAKLYESLGEEQKAQDCIDSYVEENRESSVAYNQLGCKQMEEGNYQEAMNYFKQGLELSEVTNERELRSNLIAAYEYSGDFETAKTEMENYLADYPEDAAAVRENFFLNKNKNR